MINGSLCASCLPESEDCWLNRDRVLAVETEGNGGDKYCREEVVSKCGLYHWQYLCWDRGGGPGEGGSGGEAAESDSGGEADRLDKRLVDRDWLQGKGETEQGQHNPYLACFEDDPSGRQVQDRAGDLMVSCRSGV